jgi:hypothetical protein
MSKSQPPPVMEVSSPENPGVRPPVLAVRLGRGRTGGTTGLSLLIDLARSQGRRIIAADGDRRNATLASFYPDAMQPPSDDTADVRDWIADVLDKITDVLDKMVETHSSGFRCILVLPIRSGTSRGMARQRRVASVRQDPAFKGRQFTPPCL